jgi:hypothetical protein
VNKPETIVRLLPHWPDWLEGSRGDSRSDQKGSRLLLHDYDLGCRSDDTGIYSPFTELDKVLTLMSHTKRDYLTFEIKGGRNDGAVTKMKVHFARRHVIAWYAPQRHRTVPKQRTRPSGRREWVKAVEPVRDVTAREIVAQAGVVWICQRFDFDKSQRGIVWLDKNGIIPGLTCSCGSIRTRARR